MKNVIISTKEIKSETIEHAMEEITTDETLFEKAKIISESTNWGLADTIEAIATHIIINDTDYVHDLN